MAEEMTERQTDFEETRSINKPPRRLFGIVAGRLKLEKRLRSLKNKFSASSAALAVCVALIALAIFVLSAELAGSEFRSLVSAVFSDAFAVSAFYKYSVLAVLESMPVVALSIFFASSAALMFALRFAVIYFEKIQSTGDAINKNKKIWM